jgi:uncharacterized membrane protein
MMTLDLATLAAILGMALATFLTRVSGLLLLDGVTLTGRVRAALDALPAAILMAVIAPTILTTGLAEAIAAALAAVAAFLRLPIIMVVIIGVASVVALRAVL